MIEASVPNLRINTGEKARCVVISQPMLFPWVGMFEQIRLADVYVHYTDVQFSKGGFVNRVQIKTRDGFRWLTVPLRDLSLGQNIDAVEVNAATDWRSRHLDFLAQALRGAPHVSEALALVESVYANGTSRLADIAIHSLEAVLGYFGLTQGRRFVRSPELRVDGTGSARVLAVVQKLGGTVYVTGHGARNYLEHETFECAGVRVEYMDYRRTPYPQLHGAFNPHVSILDLIANTGRAGLEYLHSQTVDWRKFA